MKTNAGCSGKLFHSTLKDELIPFESIAATIGETKRRSVAKLARERTRKTFSLKLDQLIVKRDGPVCTALESPAG